MMRSVYVAFALLVAGCGSAPSMPSYKGVLRLAWTIEGQPVSDAACADIDHLVITVESSPSVGVAIEPVACAHGVDWERDDVPAGFDTIVVDAVNRNRETTLESVSMIGVTETRMGAPTVVDLQAL
jgi:hypothetical protein